MTSGFHVADLNVRGELIAQQEYRYTHLEQFPGAVELITCFATLIWRSPEEFETPVPMSDTIQARWRSSSPSSGILTLRCEMALASVSLLASGISPDADRLTFAAFQSHLLRELHGTANEPAFALLDLTERPVVATINFEQPTQSADQLIVALADRCFAAAYFRTLNLV